MNEIKRMLEQVNAGPLVAHVRNHAGVYVFVVIVAAIVLVGVALGYTPEQVMGWLQLGD